MRKISTGLTQRPPTKQLLLKQLLLKQLLLKRSLILILPVLLVACSGVFESQQPPDRVYWLEPLIVHPPIVPTIPVQSTSSTGSTLANLAVSVTAAPGLDSERLLILEPDARLNYYAAARWPDNISGVLESLLRSTLESTGRYARVSRGTSPLASDRHLALDLRELYVLSNSAGEAISLRVLAQGHLDCGSRGTDNKQVNKHVITEEQATDYPITLQADIAVSDNRLSKIVAAYQSAVTQVSQQLLEQTAGSCGDLGE